MEKKSHMRQVRWALFAVLFVVFAIVVSFAGSFGIYSYANSLIG